MANLQISGCLVDLWGDLWYNICRKSCLARLSALPLRAGHGCDIESLHQNVLASKHFDLCGIKRTVNCS